MKNRWMVVLATGAVAATLATGAAFGADAAKKKAKAPEMDPKAMEEAWMKAATPGEEHKRLASFAGSWTAEITMWMEPGKDPIKSKGTTESKMVLGGRFLQQNHTGEFMGQPFEGMGFTGYDNIQKKYIGLWVDVMGTCFMMSEGHDAKDGKSTMYTASFPDPMTGKMKWMEEKLTVIDDDHHTFEMWSADKGAKKTKAMEIAYTRKK